MTAERVETRKVIGSLHNSPLAEPVVDRSASSLRIVVPGAPGIHEPIGIFEGRKRPTQRRQRILEEVLELTKSGPTTFAAITIALQDHYPEEYPDYTPLQRHVD